MKTYLFKEVCGKQWGEAIIIEAENAIQAMQKAGMTEWIKPYKKFSHMVFGKMFEVAEMGKVNAEYICTGRKDD